MRFKTTQVKGSELNPGDLFSTMGQLYWNDANIKTHHSIGESVYIRTEESAPATANDTVYRIEVER